MKPSPLADANKQMPSFHHKRPHKPTRLKAPIFLHIKDPSIRGGKKRKEEGISQPGKKGDLVWAEKCSS
jgi:hypothetical protein